MRAALPKDLFAASAWSDDTLSCCTGWTDADAPRTGRNIHSDPSRKMMAQTAAGTDFSKLRAPPAVALLRGCRHLVRIGRDPRIAGDAFCIRNKSMVLVMPRADSTLCYETEKFLPLTIS
jgi:hypothetical protein